MRITRITTAALVLLAAAGITAAPVTAEPTADAPARAHLDLSGSMHHLDYRVTATEDRRAAVATVEGGRFELIADDRIVTLTDQTGYVVAAFPMTVHAAGEHVDLTPVIEESGTRLTLTPVAASPTPIRDINAEERFFAETERHMPTILAGAAIGGAIGFIIGFPLGLFVLDFITVPVATVVGAAIGAFAGLATAGGQPAIDATVAYLTRTP
ncbi:hypothetical protein [Nocardia donostiensis]|uniref:DUF8020 domain-containing protein n=1 Tax=Nocardia donostiensis TaxID=1538463 RepID=A0A1W0AY96_9NOCA|nr:hypothetical protein [Nocardia donostiensis]ONM47125.1 hypothetical protein B0T46_19275 [Nocardia donostiensis]OQS15204.1 hypothetical protein B0T36_11225 [Nocardia donostiensis]OQS20110.1 hypothetical protein B0T44_11265 [Nocardia donostiensis]